MLKENIKNIHKEFNFATDEDRRDFNNALHCWICKGSPNEDRYAARPKADKARDHCHFTGKYRGAAHYICSLQFKKLNSLLSSFTTWLVLTLIYWLRISAKAEETSNVFPKIHGLPCNQGCFQNVSESPFLSTSRWLSHFCFKTFQNIMP